MGSIITGYGYGVLLGIAVALWRVWATPEITNYLAVRINWKGRKQSVRVQHSPGTQAVAVQGDDARIRIEQNPRQTAQQLAELVYTPLRNEATSWLDPGGPTFKFGAWTELEAKVPQLVQLVHPDIAQIFSQAERVYRRIAAINLSMGQIWLKADAHARKVTGLTEFTVPGSVGPGSVVFNIHAKDDGLVQAIWLGRLWFSGKTLKEFVPDFVDKNFPKIEWELYTQIDGYTVLDDTNRTLQFAGAAESFLNNEPKAVEVQQKYMELRDLGIRARRRIKEELSKLVRLKT